MISLTPGEVSAIGWAAGGIGLAAVAAIDTWGWFHWVPYWKQRLWSMPIVAVATAILLWSWHAPPEAPSPALVAGATIFFESGLALRNWLWERRIGHSLDRIRRPRPGGRAN
jgi:hypothetical protein